MNGEEDTIERRVSASLWNLSGRLRVFGLTTWGHFGPFCWCGFWGEFQLNTQICCMDFGWTVAREDKGRPSQGGADGVDEGGWGSP